MPLGAQPFGRLDQRVGEGTGQLLTACRLLGRLDVEVADDPLQTEVAGPVHGLRDGRDVGATVDLYADGGPGAVPTGRAVEAFDRRHVVQVYGQGAVGGEFGEPVQDLRVAPGPGGDEVGEAAGDVVPGQLGPRHGDAPGAGLPLEAGDLQRAVALDVGTHRDRGTGVEGGDVRGDPRRVHMDAAVGRPVHPRPSHSSRA